MAQKITLKAADGTTVEFIDEIKAQGGVKDVYFSPDKSYVVAFYRTPVNPNDKERINNIVGVYREKIFNGPGGEYWKQMFAWPTKMVEWNGKTGIVMPFYDRKYFFSGGPFNGKEKEGKWFASAKLRNRFLPADQKGTFLTNLHMCIKIARAVRRLHAAGLAHSDLSYKNILVDPITGAACIIDDDSLVVVGRDGVAADGGGHVDRIGDPLIGPDDLELGDVLDLGLARPLVLGSGDPELRADLELRVILGGGGVAVYEIRAVAVSEVEARVLVGFRIFVLGL